MTYHADRLAALRAAIDAPLLVSHLPNLRWLTGFTGSSAFLLAAPDAPTRFLTDGRYGEAAAPLIDALDDAELVVYSGSLWDSLKDMTSGMETVGLEAQTVTWKFSEEFGRECDARPVAGGGEVEELRRTKDDSEVELLLGAARAGDGAFAELGELLEPDGTERDLAWALIEAMRSAGGEIAGWDPIVASGPRASVPHHESGGDPVGEGLLLLDYGCVVDGYHSDMTRTVWLEGPPDPEMAAVHEAVLAAQQAGIDAVAPGVSCDSVDEAVRAVLRGYGYEDGFLHSTGHGVGLEIHEAPWVRKGNDDALRVGDVITVEPGVYLAGRGGVRIEDMVLVTEEGARMLTQSPRGFE